MSQRSSGGVVGTISRAPGFYQQRKSRSHFLHSGFITQLAAEPALCRFAEYRPPYGKSANLGAARSDREALDQVVQRAVKAQQDDAPAVRIVCRNDISDRGPAVPACLRLEFPPVGHYAQ